MRYDVVIVGAGSAGCVLAARLAEDGRRSVLLIEAGPDYPDPAAMPKDLRWGNNFLLSAIGPHNWGYLARASDEQPNPIPVPRGKTIGGTSAINGQVLLRGEPDDYDGWAALGNPEWSFARVLPYFTKLETDCDFSDDFHGATGPIPVRRYRRSEMLPHAQAFYSACLAAGFPEVDDHNRPHSGGIGPAPINNRDGIRIATSVAYLQHLRSCPALTIEANVHVRRIVFEGRRAVGVEGERNGARVTFEAHEVVLSAGAIGSPHVLMLSGVGPAYALRAHGIEIVHDLPGVGRHLRDHPYVILVFRETGPAPDVGHTPAQALLRYTADGSTERNDLHVGPLALNFADVMPGGAEARCFGIYAALQRSASVGDVTLTSPDPAVQPALHYRYLTDPWDRQRLRQAVRLVIRLTQHPAFADVIVEQVSMTDEELATDAGLDAALIRNVGIGGLHSAGTCRMGPSSDGLAVVDQYGMVHGLRGLRIVDASIMPDVVRANTNATTIMMAERVADWMRQGEHR